MTLYKDMIHFSSTFLAHLLEAKLIFWRQFSSGSVTLTLTLAIEGNNNSERLSDYMCKHESAKIKSISSCKAHGLGKATDSLSPSSPQFGLRSVCCQDEKPGT